MGESMSCFLRVSKGLNAQIELQKNTCSGTRQLEIQNVVQILTQRGVNIFMQ